MAQAHYDILTFRAPQPRPIEHDRQYFGSPDCHFPGVDRQYARLGGMMQSIERKAQVINAEIQASENGFDPDYVLVFEVVGNVGGIVRAINNIEGFHFLSDEDWEETLGEEEFYELNSRGERVPVAQRLYAVLSNRHAVSHLMALWNKYRRGEEFNRGETPIRHLFEQLNNVHYWDVDDRINGTQIIEDLRERIASGNAQIPLEIELWFYDNPNKSLRAEETIRAYVEHVGGEVISRCLYREIKYHAMAVKLPAQVAGQIINRGDCEILTDHSVRLLKPLGQAVSAVDPDEQSVGDAEEIPAPLYDNPICALLDGLPVENHALLRNFLIVDDPDGYAANYQVQSRSHGTSMASLIIHGDLNAHGTPISRKLYVRPIMKPRGDNEEGIPDGVLFPDILYRAIEHMRHDPTLNDICVVNLSVCDPSKMFSRTMSAEARMIDWLSTKYHVLFIVSAGNHSDMLEFDGERTEFMSLPQVERDRRVYADHMRQAMHLRLYAPAETVNNLTIGALHADFAGNPQDNYDLIPFGMPALYSAIGPGVNRCIKPDCVMDGGRQLYRGIEAQARFRPTKRQLLGPGHLVASKQNPRAQNYTWGTSNSAALASHFCHELYEILRVIPNANLSRDDMALAIKTMFIHGCSWEELYNRILNVIPNRRYQKRKDVARLIGYGVPDMDKVKWCTDDRAVIFGRGTLHSDRECDFELPLPQCLLAQSVRKRLTVTLAWTTPISVNAEPRKVRMYFKPTNASIIGTRLDSDKNMSVHGTIQHEVYEGDNAMNFQQGDSIKITVERKRDGHNEPVDFMLMVTLEVAEGSGLPIYNEVKASLEVGVPIMA